MMTPWTLALSSTLVGLAVLLAAIAISLDAEASAWPHRIALKSTSSDNPNSTVQYVESVVSSRDANRKAERPRHLVIFWYRSKRHADGRSGRFLEVHSTQHGFRIP